MQLMFIWRILLLPVCNIYKKTAITRISYHIYNSDGDHRGPCKHAVDTFKKYGLMNILYSAFESGVYMSLDVFKRMVKCKVWEYEKKCFEATCLLYRSVPTFTDCQFKIEMWIWWKIVCKKPTLGRQCKLLARILFSQSALNSDTSKYNGSK